MNRDSYRLNHVSVIYQNFNLFQHLTVLENAAYPLYVRKMPKKKADELAAEKLLQVGLKEDQFKRFPNMLSGGEQQRVAIARALTSGSELILAIWTVKTAETLLVFCKGWPMREIAVLSLSPTIPQ